MKQSLFKRNKTVTSEVRRLFRTLLMFIIMTHRRTSSYKAKQRDHHLFRSKYFWPQSCVSMPSLPKQGWAHSQTHNHQFPVDDSSLLLHHPSTSSAPFLHPSIHPAAQKKRCLFSSPPSSLPLSHSWNTVRRCKGAVFTRNYPPSITRHGIRGQAPARPPFRPAVTRGNYVLPGPLNRSRALGVEIEAPWWNSVLVVNARQPDVELPQPSDNDTFRHSAINWKSLAWLCLNRMHLVCPAPWAWGQAATWLMGGWSESKGSRRPFRGHGVYAMLEHNLSLINVKEGL